MGRVTTPRIITPQIRELCQSLSEYEPVYVAVKAFSVGAFGKERMS